MGSASAMYVPVRLHLVFCDGEECPRCHGQLIVCEGIGCLDQRD
jgi:hypothetical protein